jgi:hypothetical protein
MATNNHTVTRYGFVRISNLLELACTVLWYSTTHIAALSPAQPFPSLRLRGVDNYYYFLLRDKGSLSFALSTHLAG